MADISRRHSLVVRITHWTNTIAFLALLISGAAILLAHPRLYWGDTGAFGSPALLELPLPLNLDQSGWGRSLHFMAAWICVFNGSVYVAFGVVSRHFMNNLRPFRDGVAVSVTRDRLSAVFGRGKHAQASSSKYNAVQQMSYLAVIFVLFPLMILSGLAMSPAVTAAVPATVEV